MARESNKHTSKNQMADVSMYTLHDLNKITKTSSLRGVRHCKNKIRLREFWISHTKEYLDS